MIHNDAPFDHQYPNQHPMSPRTAKTHLLPALAVATSFTAAQAGDYGKAIINDKMPIEDSSWCDLFKKNTLYKGDGFIQSVKLKGRYHGQWISQTEDTLAGTNGYHDYQHRRFRLGTEIGMAHDLKFVSIFNIADGTGGNGPADGGHGLTHGTFFDDVDDFYIEWTPSDDFYIIVGKTKQLILREYETSSNSILTIERSAITSSVVSNKPWGIAVGFNALGLDHELGAWITGADRDAAGERWDWPDFDSRGSATYRASYDLTEATSAHFDYQFTNNSDGRAAPNGSADTNLGSSFEHVAAIGTESKFGQFGLITDLIAAQNGVTGGGLPAGYDTWGLVVMPYYNLTDKLQFVTRYAYMDEGREQRTQRYDLRQSVENYHTFYAGFNYYLCGNNLKLMAGYEYATGDVFATANDEVNTSSWMLGLRSSW